MRVNDDQIKYQLPDHRLKILGSVIFGLLLFLCYTISKIEEEITLLDFLLIPTIVFLAFWFRSFLKRYSKVGFLINQSGLFNLDGSIICEIGDIERIDVSPYTFKSANGFIVILKTKSSFKSIPGLYWRLGNRLSIGGLVSKNESKFLSQTLLGFYEENEKKTGQNYSFINFDNKPAVD